MVRTHRDALESRYEMKLDGQSVVLPWIVTHAAATISRFRVGTDGRSTLHRLAEKRCRKDQGEIGSCVMCLKPGTEGKSKADVRWKYGIYLGMISRTEDYLVGTEHGVLKGEIHQTARDDILAVG